MGIKEIGTFLKKQNVDCFYKVPLSEFYGKRVSIDAMNWVYTYLHPAIKVYIDGMTDPLGPINFDELEDNLMKHFFIFNIRFLEHKITPVWVWDGESKDEKKGTKNSRREERQKMTIERENIRSSLSEMSVLEWPDDAINRYKKLLACTTYYPTERIEKLRKISKDMGIPTITAPDEGEFFCSYLAIERLVAAVWSRDTDTYAIGAPIVMKNFIQVNGQIMVDIVYTPNILNHFDLNHQEFRDFCIMCGCDFNQRIPDLGPARSMKLIKKYRNIDAIAEHHGLDVQFLKHHVCRDFFNPEDTEYLLNEDDLNLKVKDFDSKYPLVKEILHHIKITPKAKSVPSSILEDSEDEDSD